MKDSPSVDYLQQARLLQRSLSSASRSSKPPAPQPFPKSSSPAGLQKTVSTGSQQLSSSSNLSDSYVTLPRTGQARSQSADMSSNATAIKSNVLVHQSIAQARAQLEAMQKLRDILNKPAPAEANTATNDNSNVSEVDGDTVVADLLNFVEKETELNNGTVLETVSGYEVSQAEDIKKEKRPANLHQTQVDQPHIEQEQLHHSGTDPEPASTVASPSSSRNISADKENIKRIDPLLQHDIVLAALARQAKTETRKPISENYKNPPTGFLEEKPNTKTTKEITKHDGIISDTTRSNGYTPQTPEENAVLQSDVLAVSKKMVSSEFDKRSWASNSSQSTEFEGTSFANSAEKFRDNLPQLENGFDPEDRSSAVSIDFPKRSSIQSEDMSISSSNTSLRVFSPDWTPEHDLDSDDDIMDSNYAKTERRVSSEGFKVSIVPPKVRDLNGTPKSKTHKRNKKRNEVKSAVNPLSNDKSKFGSLRKLKKNVHQGVKNAFGSISKAPGTILSKQKSQDLYDNSETKSPNRSAAFDNDVPASFRNLNWMLSRSIDESLHRRTLNDDFFNQRSVSTVEHSDLSENSEDDEIGDIDFAAGINDIPEANSNSRHTKLARKKAMLKPTSDKYTNTNGQIDSAENHDLNVNGHTIKNIGDIDQHSRTTHKKGKQPGNESASRMKEQSKFEEVLAKMIAEKEQQYEIEKLRQQETESNIRRLRDLEGKEMLQRLQNEIAHEEISRLQQQQLIMRAGSEMNNNAVRVSSLSKLSPQTSGSSLNNNALNSSNLGIGFNNEPLRVSPLNNLGVSPGSAGITAAYINASPLSSPSTYLANGNAAFLQTGYLNSSVNFQNTKATRVQQGYNMPFLSTAAVGQPISPIGVTNTNYMLPLVPGAGVNDGFTNKTAHNLTPQELVYLGEYMRMIGVPPPANNHEWALLLNTVSHNMSSLPMVGQHPGPITFPVAPNNPNLSSLLVNKNSFNDHTPQLTLQIVDVIPSQQSLHSNQTPQILHKDESTTVLPQLQNYTNKPSLNPEYSDTTFSNNTTVTGTVRVAELHPQPAHSASSAHAEDSAKTKATKTKATKTKATKASGNEDSTSGEDDTGAPTDSITKPDSLSAISENCPQTSTVSTGAPAKTYLLPAKVYAPLGFRPVSFSPSAR